MNTSGERWQCKLADVSELFHLETAATVSVHSGFVGQLTEY